MSPSSSNPAQWLDLCDMPLAVFFFFFNSGSIKNKHPVCVCVCDFFFHGICSLQTFALDCTQVCYVHCLVTNTFLFIILLFYCILSNIMGTHLEACCHVYMCNMYKFWTRKVLYCYVHLLFSYHLACLLQKVYTKISRYMY